MARHPLQTSTRYRYGKRAYLYPGYRFRASGGPYYVGIDDHGGRIRIPMGETGVFTFRRYCQQGASKWIEATREEYGTVIIYVGRRRRSPLLDGLRWRPHRIRPVYRRKRPRRRTSPGPVPVQRMLFEVK